MNLRKKPVTDKTIIEVMLNMDPAVFIHVKLVPFPGNLLFNKEDLPGPCWLWTGAQDVGPKDRHRPYGKLKRKGKTWRVHIYTATKTMRKVRIDEDVHHDCENSLCCNPFHLSIVPSEEHSKRGPPSNYLKDCPF